MKISKKPGRALVGGLLVATIAGVIWVFFNSRQQELPTVQIQKYSVAFPEGIKGQRVKAYFAAYASGDPEEYARWLSENRTKEAFNAAPLEDRVGRFEDEIEEFGKFVIGQIREIDGDSLEVIFQATKNREWLRMVFTFEDQAPYRIGAMLLESTTGLGKPETFDFAWNNLAEFIDKYRAKTGIPAVALAVLGDGEIKDIAARGQRVLNGPENVELTDKFHWGSLTKSVTGTMLGKLIEDGVLNWDTTVGEVLGDLEMRDEYRGAKLWQIMGHQAGFPEYTSFNLAMAERFEGFKGTEKQRRGLFVAELLMEQPLGPPGEIGAYSNAGLTVAGYMAEVATGKTWQALVQELVFDPLGMATAGFGWPTTRDDPNQPRGHFGTGPGNYEPQADDALEVVRSIISPAGNVHSSIGDLMKYAQFHLDGMAGKDGYLKSETVQGLHNPQPEQDPVMGGIYTFGWGQGCPGSIEGEVCHGHNGSAGSYYAELRLYPEDNMAIAYFTNVKDPAEAYSEKLFRTILTRFKK